MIVEVFHKVGESSCIFCERQLLADVVVIPVLIEIFFPRVSGFVQQTA
jgi:hypothetical protein